MPTIILKSTTIVGRRCVSVWQMPNKSIVKIEIPPAEYDKLRNGSFPPGVPHKDAVWLGASEHPLFNTLSGLLEAGCIVAKPEGFMVVKTGIGSPKTDRFLINTSKHSVSGSGNTFSVELPGYSIKNGVLTY